MNKKHFLLFQVKSVCYDSYIYFSNALAKALTNAGHAVEIFSALEEPLEAAERFVGRTFDAIIDFNSELPMLQMEDDSYFLDHIDAPFYDVILDHPLYHHKKLKQQLRDFHILCLDENHRNYITTYYPHIASAHVWEMTGDDICPNEISYPPKDIDVLFSGTYTSPCEVADSIDTCPAFLGNLTRNLIELIEAEPSLTQEAALQKLLPSLDEAEVIEENFTLHMQACFLCDSYLRAAKREQLLVHLAKENIPLTLCGNGWRKSPLAQFPQIQIIDDTSFYDTFSLFRRAKITLNLLPEFKNGSHDRVYSAMLNHSLCLTDASPLLKKEFADGRELCFYDAQNPEGLTHCIQDLLIDESRCISITQNGYAAAKKDHTWDARVVSLMTVLDSCAPRGARSR